MPNRILRDGILTSERVNSLGAEAEVFYRRLMSVADDFGRFHAHPALLRAALYPLKLDTVADTLMARLLQEVEAAGLVRTYAVGGKRYLLVEDFRQRVRANESKFPAPPDASDSPHAGVPPHDRTLTAACAPPAGLDGGGDGCAGVDVCEGGGAGAAAQPAAGSETPAGAAPPLHVQIAVKLREGGVAITSAHPQAQAWAARGVSVGQALEALAIARLRKPAGRIAPNYLAPIIDDMLQPVAAVQTRAAAPPAWWASEAATLARGRELGLNARPGEAMSEYRARLSEAIAQARAAPP